MTSHDSRCALCTAVAALLSHASHGRANGGVDEGGRRPAADADNRTVDSCLEVHPHSRRSHRRQVASVVEET
eukprot:7051111-Prymnesium_polylepis.1